MAGVPTSIWAAALFLSLVSWIRYVFTQVLSSQPSPGTRFHVDSYFVPHLWAHACVPPLAGTMKWVRRLHLDAVEWRRIATYIYIHEI